MPGLDDALVAAFGLNATGESLLRNMVAISLYTVVQTLCSGGGVMKVLVTGVTWSAGLAVVHSLARDGHEVIGVDTRKLRLGIQSRFLHRSYTIPRQEEGFIAALKQVIRIEKPELPMPVGDSHIICRSKQAKIIDINPRLPGYIGFLIHTRSDVEVIVHFHKGGWCDG